jgi:hypothetical protein
MVPSILELRIRIQDVVISNLPDPQHLHRVTSTGTHIPLHTVPDTVIQPGRYQSNQVSTVTVSIEPHFIDHSSFKF